MDDLRDKTIRGAAVRLFAQGSNFGLRLGSLVILARLLTPKDFGLVGMVTAVTGVLSLFRDFGLSAASVQRGSVTHQQTSTLFWINVVVGAVLSAITAGVAPLVVLFYHESRLYWVTVALASGFIINAFGIQHAARLQREMRFTALSVIDTGSLIVSTAVGFVAARAGFGYWALVAMTLTGPLCATCAFWVFTSWIPGRPARRCGIRSMIRFGGTLTVNGLIVYAASNFEKVLLGRYWGAGAIGIYGRAYQLIRIPTDTLNGTVGEVAFAALSRVQNDASRLRGYFLKGYSFVLAFTMPATFGCCLFAGDLVSVLLGPKWNEAAPIFRLLTPTILVFATANPLGWLLVAVGMVEKSLKMSLVIAPLMIVGYFIGLPYGPQGVAIAYSAVMSLWLLPVIAWSVHNTPISFNDVMVAIGRPFTASAVAAVLAFGACALCGSSHLMRLIVGGIVLSVAYAGILLYVMGQKALYMQLLKNLIGRQSSREGALVSQRGVA